MSSSTKVAVAGPNGSLGQSVITHLQRAGFDITLLTRNPEKTSKQYPPPIKTVFADYDSTEQLAGVLRDGSFDTVISLINRDEVAAQNRLVDAVVDAKVPHLIPSAFGIEKTLPKVREVPALKTKVQAEEHLLAKAKEGTFTWTEVNTGMFLDYALERGVLVNLSNNGRPTPVFGSGDVRVSVTTVDSIGRAVAAALQVKREDVQNRILYVHDAVITQNQLLGYARELAPDREFKTISLDCEKMAEEAREKMRNGDNSPEVLRAFMPLVTFGWGLGVFEHPDNQLLGLKEWDEEQLKALVKKVLEALQGRHQ